MQVQTTETSKENQNMTDSIVTAVATTEAPQRPQNAPKKPSANKGASPKKNAPKAKKRAKETKPRKQARASVPKSAADQKQRKPSKAAKPATEARDGSKKAIILDLLRRPKGATLDELMNATKWQAHSVRGFIAGPVKRAGLIIESSKSEAGERTYRIVR
jgi:hypothetical protein